MSPHRSIAWVTGPDAPPAEDSWCPRLGVTRHTRIALTKQRPTVLWLTGISGAGKSTIANAVELRLNAQGIHTYLLDGDLLRRGLNVDLGFDSDARDENVRRTAEVARLMADAGLIVIVCLISPLRVHRQRARDIIGAGDFVEVYIDTPLAVAEARDPKRLYKMARAGVLRHFTGIDSPYEPPEAADVHLQPLSVTPDDAADRIWDHLRMSERI